MQVSHLYRITDQETGKYYIGKHKGWVQGKYWGSGKKWKDYIKKHGTDNLKYEILVIANEDYILDLEGRYITLDYINQNPLCMNLKEGGVQAKLSPESIEQMASKLRGRPSWNKGISMPEETKLKLSLAKKGTPPPNKGKPMSAETKLKVSLAKKGTPAWNKGKKLSEETKSKLTFFEKGRTPWNKGKPQLPHVIEAARQSNLGKKQSEETKQKRREKAIGRKMSEEVKLKMSEIQKAMPKVVCVHCQKIGGFRAMKRWHFDNCKLKGI